LGERGQEEEEKVLESERISERGVGRSEEKEKKCNNIRDRERERERESKRGRKKQIWRE